MMWKTRQGFKSCHPYLLLLLWAVTRDQLRSIQIGQNSEFHFSICMRYKNHPFLYCFISRKALLVQFGRTCVSKTQCRRFKSYRAWFCSCYVESKKRTYINIRKWDSNEVHIVIVIKRKICKHSLWESGLSDLKLLEKDLCDRLIISRFFKVSRQGCLDRNRTSIPPSSDSMQQWGRPVYTFIENSISSCRTPILSQQLKIDMRSWTQGAPMFWAEALMRAIRIRW